MSDNKFPDYLIEMWVGIRVEMSGYFPVKNPWWLLLMGYVGTTTPLILSGFCFRNKLPRLKRKVVIK